MRLLLFSLCCLTCAGQGLRDASFLAFTGVNPGPAWSQAAPAGGSGNVTNGAAITITDNTTATPYPSTITVGTLTGQVTNVLVTVYGFTHSYPSDVDMLLVGPTGEAVVLMSAIGSGAVSGIDFSFDDSGVSFSGDITDGATYRPTGTATLASPAPAATGTTLSRFNVKDPAGTWSLYIQDSSEGDAGSIASGWSLVLTTTAEVTTNYASPFAYFKADSEASGFTEMVEEVATNNLYADVAQYSQAGKINQGWTMNRSDLYRTNDSAYEFASHDFAMRAWYRTDGMFPAADMQILNRSNFWIIQTANSNLIFTVATSGGDVSVTNGPFHRNTWLWFTAWHDTGNEVGISINNGTPVTASTGDAMTAASGDGVSFRFLCNTNADYSCRWDEIGFWKDHVLNASERAYDYNGGAGRSKP